jgi:very-short-patch-repair endonuclease
MIFPETGRGTIRKANGGGGASLRKPAVYKARKLRRQMSPPEALLWSELRGNKIGFKVRRQHPIGPYVVDFFIRDGALIIEIDGSSHDYGDRPERDAVRESYLIDSGYRILRIAAGDVMRNLEGALKYIVVQATNPLHHQAALDGPPPRPGEEQ